MKAWFRAYCSETYWNPGFEWSESVYFIDYTRLPHIIRKGRIVKVDPYGSGPYPGVCATFDILSKGILYRHIPITNVKMINSTVETAYQTPSRNSTEDELDYRIKVSDLMEEKLF